MQKLVLDIEENRYTLLLQFLKTLNYVKIVQSSRDTEAVLNPKASVIQESQLQLLKEALDRQSKPLFQNIEDPVAWQKQQRGAI